MVLTRAAVTPTQSLSKDGDSPPATLQNLGEKLTELDTRFTRFESLLTKAVGDKSTDSTGGGKITSTSSNTRASPYPQRQSALHVPGTSGTQNPAQLAFTDLLSATPTNSASSAASAPAFDRPITCRNFRPVEGQGLVR